MWIDDDLIFPLEETFGDICKKESPFPDDYLFYDPSFKTNFENKFKLHYKYNQIGYSSLEMFKDHFKDILDLNYPKYKHYFDTLEKAKSLKWWNNKDLLTEFTRQLDKQEGTTFVSTLDKVEKMLKSLDKTGTVGDAYVRDLTEHTTEKLNNDVVNDLRKSGSNVKEVAKGTTLTTDFTRDLNSTDNITVNDTKESSTASTNTSESTSDSENDSKNTTSNLNRTLDTPQGNIGNLTSANINGYMSTGTADDGTDNTMTISNTHSTGTGSSTDKTNSTDKKVHQEIGTETGTTKNIEKSTGTDTTTDTLGERHNTVISDKKINDIILEKRGNATDTKTYNTKDATTRDLTGKDTTNSNEEMTGQDNETYTKREEGNIGVTSAGQLVNDWIKWGYVALDKMIIRDCEKLFLQVY